MFRKRSNVRFQQFNNNNNKQELLPIEEFKELIESNKKIVNYKRRNFALKQEFSRSHEVFIYKCRYCLFLLSLFGYTCL